jgi:hypothetical protein
MGVGFHSPTPLYKGLMMIKELQEFLITHKNYVLVYDIIEVERGTRIDVVYSINLCDKFEVYSYLELDGDCDGSSYVSFDDAENNLLENMKALKL